MSLRPFAFLIWAAGCAVASPVPRFTPGGDGDATAADPPSNADDAALGAGTALGNGSTGPAVPSPAPADLDAAAASDAAAAIDAPVPSDDGTSESAPVPAPDGACSAPPGPGDLTIDELLIASVAGTGDYGEWLEIRSGSSCILNLRGLHGECANGSKVRTFDIPDDVWLLPQGTVVVADSASRALNHDLPGTLLVWSGQPGDVLRNNGTTVTLRWQNAVVDSLTYPALPVTVGASIAFPADCPPDRRSDWSAWQSSTGSWFPGFYGTPNATNDDVHCL